MYNTNLFFILLCLRLTKFKENREKICLKLFLAQFFEQCFFCDPIFGKKDETCLLGMADFGQTNFDNLTFNLYEKLANLAKLGQLTRDKFRAINA